MKRSQNLRRAVALFLFISILLSLFVVAPALAQEAPTGIPSFELVKYICPSNVPLTGTSIPTGCVHPDGQNASNIPTVTPGGPISFIYGVTYRCDGVGECAGIDPATVVIGDNQLPSVSPTVFGQLSGNGDNVFDPGETWGYVVNSRTAINLSTQGGTLPQPPVTGCAAAPDGLGARPTYKNTAQVTGPFASNSSDSYYCNPLAASLTIKKYTNGEDADTPPGPEIQQGGTVEWTYRVTNNGTTTLTDVRVTDSRGVVVTCPQTTLAPGESMICTASGTAALGQYENVGTAVGTAPTGTVLSVTDPSHYYGVGRAPKPTPKPVPIPEPVTVVLFGTGLAALSAAVATSRKRND